jgi:hypothetical protein
MAIRRSSCRTAARFSLALGIVSACWGCAPTPYGLSVGTINETAPARHAAILMSDPQIYARETLLNDRLRESKYLADALKRSETVPFEPTIRRELRTLQEFAASFRGGVDIGAARDFERQNEIRDLRQQSEIAKLQADIEYSRRQMDAIRGSGVTAPTNRPGGESNPPSADTEAAQRIAKLEEKTAALEKELKDKLDSLRNAKFDTDVPATRRSATQSSPEEEYEDRKAFREKIRADLAAVSLDDLHDADGNGLYRLQFRATILPGEPKDKFGVARLTLRPPVLNEAEIAKLYNTWLWHVALRLNQPTTYGGSRPDVAGTIDPLYRALSTQGLYAVREIDLGEVTQTKPDRGCENLFATGKENDKEVPTCVRLALPLPTVIDPVFGALFADSTTQPRPGRSEWRYFYGEARRTGVDDDAIQLKRMRQASKIVEYYSREIQVQIDSVRGAVARGNFAPVLSSTAFAQLSFGEDCRPAGARVHQRLPQSVYAKAFEAESVGDSSGGNIFESRDFATAFDIAFATETFRQLFVPVFAGMMGAHADKQVATDAMGWLLRLAAIDKVSSSELLNQIALATYLHHRATGKNESAALDEVRKCAGIEQGTIDVARGGAYVPAEFRRAVILGPEKPVAETIDNNTVALPWGLGNRAQINLFGLIREIEQVRQRALVPGQNTPDTTSPAPAPIRAKGRGFAYATTPFESAQRLSTAASATRRLDIALSLAAMVPGSGISGEAGARFSRSATGNLDALERVPLVVGFSDRQIRNTPIKVASTGSATGLVAETDPVIGWVFGPPVNIDTREDALRHRQRVINHSVSSDVSLPSWWPWIEVGLETAWVGNWHGGAGTMPVDTIDWGAESKDRERVQKVFLPRARADLEGLTSHLAREIYGTRIRSTQIQGVSPSELNACINEGQLLVFGNDLWRGAEVFLNGIRHKDMSVLPDMSGLAVTFDMRLVRETVVRRVVSNTERRPAPYSTSRTDANLDVGVKLDLTVVSRSGRDSTSEVSLFGSVEGCAPGVRAASIAIAPSIPRVVGNETLRLDWRGPRPLGALKVRFRNSELAAWAGDTDAIFNAARNQVVTSANVAALPPALFSSGDELQIGILVSFGSSGRPEEYLAGKAIYYKDAADAQISVARIGVNQRDGIRNRDFVAELNLPANADKAFPALLSERMSLRAEFKGNPAVKLKAETLAYKGASGKLQVRIQVLPETTAQQWTDAIKQGTPTIDFRGEPDANPEFPALKTDLSATFNPITN